MKGGERSDEHDPREALWVIQRKPLDNATPHRMAGKHGRLELERVHKGHHICREVAKTISRHRTIRIAVATLGQRKGVDVWRKIRQYKLK
jgi:hypothetical protein